MCFRRKQQGGWRLLVCESWLVHRVEAIEGEVVSYFSYFSYFSVSKFILPSFLNLRRIL